MKRPSAIAPGLLQRRIQAAEAAWNRKDFQECLDTLESASRLDPANVHILLNLGERYGFRYRVADAERCFDKAVRIAPNPAEISAIAGRLAAGFGNYPLAERFLQHALAKNATSDTLARLAELYERLRRAAAATNMAERALQLDEACPLARLTLAKIQRQAGRLTEAEHVLRPILAAANREMRVKGFYELGTILDRQNRYDEAMAAFLEAKNLLRPDAPPKLAELQHIIRHLQEMKENVSEEMLTRWATTGRESLQPLHRLAFLGGHARSGTTLLEQVLDAHPDIVSAEETEILNEEAYSPLQRQLPTPQAPMLAVLESAANDMLRKTRESYFRAMESYIGCPVGNRLLLDKNPGKHYWIPAMIRIFPEIKFIIALRDPRDVVLSCFMLPHPISTGTVEFLSLEGSIGRYSRVMGMWQTLKPLLKNPVLEVRYEDMVADLEPVARKTLDFLGVPWDARVLGFDEHARKKLVRSPTYADVTQKVYTRARGRWRNYQKYLEPHLEKLEPFVKAFGYE